jgi:DNA repair protein RecO (recombination protein O)
VTLLESEALVVRKVDSRESDVIATLLTERFGKLAVIARGARKASRRVSGALEPVHTIGASFEDKGGELCTLKEARIVRVREGVVTNLEAFETAGIALRWARHLFPPRTPEPEGWSVLTDLLDRLDRRRPGGVTLTAELARAGLALLAAVGYALEFGRCVVCGRPCPEAKAACIDPARGGLVCLSCGGARDVLAAAVRRAACALSAGEPGGVDESDAKAVLNLVDRAMAAHTGFER